MSFIKSYGSKFEMFKVILGKENPVIVEVGSHYGEDSMRFVETFENPKIYCFEPDERNIFAFKKYIHNDKIKLFELALSDKNGKQEFYRSYRPGDLQEKYDWITEEDFETLKLSNSGASSLKKGYEHVFDTVDEVEVKRGDTWLTENNIEEIDLLWVDVQGAEKEVFAGFGDEINRVKFIWTEYGEQDYEGSLSRDECLNYLESLNFVNIDSASDKSRQGDLLFINKRYT